jgi:hypothetical protein
MTGFLARREAPEPWLRQPAESGPAYVTFEAYRDAGPLRRLSATARDLGRDYRLVKRWSARHRWQERVTAFDHYLASAAIAVRRAEAERMAARQLELADQLPMRWRRPSSTSTRGR